MKIGDTSDHNAFHIEVLSFARRTNNEGLTRHFAKRLKAIAKLMDQNLLS